VRQLVLCFVAWKLLLLVVAYASPGPGYDTSTAILYDQDAVQAYTTLDKLLLRLTRWDALYFTSSSHRGHVYEQEWAFSWALSRVTAVVSDSGSSDFNAWLLLRLSMFFSISSFPALFASHPTRACRCGRLSYCPSRSRAIAVRAHPRSAACSTRAKAPCCFRYSMSARGVARSALSLCTVWRKHVCSSVLPGHLELCTGRSATLCYRGTVSTCRDGLDDSSRFVLWVVSNDAQ